MRVLDPSFAQYRLALASVERLYTGCRWAEGPVWFGDGRYLLWSDIPNNRVLRWDEETGAVSVFRKPSNNANGHTSPDEKKLYVVASRAEPHRTIVAYDVSADGMRISGGKVLIDAGPGGSPDGFRVDVDGNLWCGWGMGHADLDGVRIFNPQGKPIGHIDLPERCANLCFGGRYRNRLFMTASHSLYALYVNTQGALGG
ncbi:MAG: SMP-30/gluconolactonase/LRE family protein [Rhodospirillales bacterium]|nr:SMP-30/gluconolactonase/LRE family protein [Rhodospirillales bacterium]